MKQFMLVLMILLVACIPIQVQAQEPEPDTTATTEIGWVGGGWDNGPVGAVGTGIKVLGDCWVYAGIETGKDQNAVLEFAYMVRPITYLSKVGLNIPYFDKLTVGLVGGPDFNWENAQENDGKPTMARIVGSVGGIAHIKISNSIGVWTFYKRKVGLEVNSFANSNVFGAGLSFNAAVLSNIF